MSTYSQPSLILRSWIVPKHFPNTDPINDILPFVLQETRLYFIHPIPNKPQQIMGTTAISFFEPSILLIPSAQKRKVQTETSSLITVTTNDSTNYQLTNSSWKDELEEI